MPKMTIPDALSPGGCMRVGLTWVTRVSPSAADHPGGHGRRGGGVRHPPGVGAVRARAATDHAVPPRPVAARRGGAAAVPGAHGPGDLRPPAGVVAHRARPGAGAVRP